MSEPWQASFRRILELWTFDELRRLRDIVAGLDRCRADERAEMMGDIVGRLLARLTVARAESSS
jgi:hypothetical protein